MPRRVKLVVYLSKDDRVMQVVSERVDAGRRFRGIISEVIEECACQYSGLPKKERK